MKKLYLICNAHLDPVWQWQWEEGAAEALSTFKSAVDLSKEYDYIFCHNEQYLYQFIEEYDPQLFKEIQNLVAQGKWRIIGGWFLQPDVLMPNGEGIIRQALYGKKYFTEKFGYFPTTTINFDSFGHSRGLVQIIKKCGQDSYIIMRPWERQLHLEDDYFIWQGYDDSEVKVVRCASYNTFLGKAVQAIEKYIEDTDKEFGVKLWGVGNHGGGPSRKDLSEIEKLIQESEVEIVHSYPEETVKGLPFKFKYDKSLIACMPGCYTSLIQLKQKYLYLENLLFEVEKMATQTYLQYDSYIYPEKELYEACKEMLTVQFHDVLSGTVIRSGEEDAIKKIDGACDLLERVRAKCFFHLMRNVKRSAPGEYCICVYNYFPYEREENVEFEFTMEKNSDVTLIPEIKIYDENDNELPLQVLKEESNVSIDCRKRIVFPYKLKPLQINRFRVTTRLIEKGNVENKPEDFSIQTPYYEASINPKTGLLENFSGKDKKYVNDEGFGLFVYEDNEDPWGMSNEQLRVGLGENPMRVVLDRYPSGVFEKLSTISVVEDGPLQKTIEALFRFEQNSFALNYVFYKNKPYFDIKLKVFWSDKNKMLKLHIPMAIEGVLEGQQVFGREELYMDGRECVAQRFLSFGKGKTRLGILNRSTYGCSYKGGILKLSLLRGATYCAHPVDNMPIIYYNRYLDTIDLGENNYHIRIGEFDVNELEREATEFCQPSYALSVSPVGNIYEQPKVADVRLSNDKISLITMKKAYEGEEVIFRLFNNSEETVESVVSVGNDKISLRFKKFEVKTLVYENGVFQERYEFVI